MDFGLHGFPSRPEGTGQLAHYRTVLERLPPEFTTVWCSDHLGHQPESWTTLTFLAATFPRFRFGHLVLSQSYRNPALVAKMAATLHELTDGRFILGLGAGWLEEEYHANGYEFPTGGVRVAQLAESIEVIRAMWEDSPATYHGTYYHVENALCEPRPQSPIPILVGTNGPKALRVVARLADMWNWDGPWEQAMRPSYEILAAHCADLGRPVEEIALTADCLIEFPADPASFVACDASSYPAIHVIGPTSEDAIRELRLLADHGVCHAQMSFDDLQTLDQFIAEVVPAFRASA